MINQCPVCQEVPCPAQPFSGLPGVQYSCLRCGLFVLSGTIANGWNDNFFNTHQRAVFSHRLRCMQGDKTVVIFEKDLLGFRLDEPLPDPGEQLDRLILWIGNRQPSAAQSAEGPVSAIDAWIGAAPIQKNAGAGLSWLLNQDEVKSVIEQRHSNLPAQIALRLRLNGWKRYETIKRDRVDSHAGFMAMKFGDPELSAVIDNYFKPAVLRAGFELRLATDSQPAGLIDDQMRVRLRTSRFTIADLTHANNGAYWEAGFAEGLGRPVIYTCRQKEWDEQKAHFDTNHLATIIWDPERPEIAATQLTAMIRATLPAEAKLTD